LLTFPFRKDTAKKSDWQIRASRSPGSQRRQQHDHKHRLRTVRPYDYHAAAFIADFWTEVAAVLQEK